MLEIGQEWLLYTTPFKLKEVASAPSGGEIMPNVVHFYVKDKSGTSALYFMNDAGTEQEIPTGIVSGSGVNGRVAFWNGTSTLSSDADMTFSVDTLSITKIIISTAATLSYITAGSILFAGTAGLLSQDNANLFWDDTNNRLGIGTAAPGFQIHAIAPDANSFNCTLEAYGTGVSANYRGRVARGTVGSPSQLLADDNCTLLSALPYNSSPGFAGGARAQIQMNAAEAQTSANQGMYIAFKTTPTGGSTTIAERFRIGPAGQWGIGGATFGTAGQYFRSGGASAAPTWATIDHGAEITGLTDDDHTQYALLAGRSGGQTLIGGTGVNDDLILQATSGNGAADTHTIQFKLGNNGAKTLGTFFINSGGSACLDLNSGAASTQFNLEFQDNAATKWILYKTTGNKFSIYDAVNNDDVMMFSATNAVAAAGAAVLVDPTISGSNATMIGLKSAPTFTGSGEGPWAFGAVCTLTPSANIGAGYANISQCVGNPAAGITITSINGAYYQTASTVSTGTITNAFGAIVAGPSYSGTTKPTSQWGMQVQNQGVAGITTAIGLQIDATSGATNNYDMAFGRVDTTAAGAYYGRVPVLYNGLLKYIHVFSA